MFADIIKDLEIVLDYSVTSESNGECSERHVRDTGRRKGLVGTSLGVQWLRIPLPVQGTQVPSLVWEDLTCHRAKSLCPTTTEPEYPRACAL